MTDKQKPVARIDHTPIRVYDDPAKQLSYVIARGAAEASVLGYITPATIEQVIKLEKEVADAKAKSKS